MHRDIFVVLIGFKLLFRIASFVCHPIFRIASFACHLLFRIASFACHLLFQIASFACHLLLQMATFTCLTSARNFCFCLIVGLSKIQLGLQIYLCTQQDECQYIIQLDALKKRPETQTHFFWHVGPVLTLLALDKKIADRYRVPLKPPEMPMPPTPVIESVKNLSNIT